MHVCAHSLDKVWERNGRAIVAAVGRRLVPGDLPFLRALRQIINQPGDLRELPRVRDQAGGGHADVGVDVGDPSVGASLVQLGGDNLFTCKDHSVLVTMILVNV